MSVHLHSLKRKRKRSGSVLLQKPLHKQKKIYINESIDNTTTSPNISILQRLRLDLGVCYNITTTIQLV